MLLAVREVRIGKKLCPLWTEGHTRDLWHSVPNAVRTRPANQVLIYFYGMAVKGPKMSKILARIKKKLTFDMIALVIATIIVFLCLKYLHFTLFTTLLRLLQKA